MTDEAEGQRNKIDTPADLLREIPGFKGYLAIEDRRDADKQLRDRLFLALEEIQKHFDLVQKDLIQTSGLTYMEQTQNVGIGLQSFMDRVKTAPRGYSSLFSKDRLDERLLEKIYSFDLELFGFVDRLAGLIDAVKETPGSDDTGETLRQLSIALGEANTAFKHRMDIMTGNEE